MNKATRKTYRKCGHAQGTALRVLGVPEDVGKPGVDGNMEPRGRAEDAMY